MRKKITFIVISIFLLVAVICKFIPTPSNEEANMNEELNMLQRFWDMELSLFGFGHVIVEPQYRGAGNFYEGLAAVIGIEGREDQTGYIDLNGSLVIPLPTANFVGDFSDGFAPVSIRRWDFENERTPVSGPLGPYIFIDRTGQDAFGQEFAHAESFRDGLARVTLMNAGRIYINTFGENAFDMVFELTGVFVDGFADVKLLDGTYTHIDRNGNIVDLDRQWGIR
jgi:hypothetical protein